MFRFGKELEQLRKQYTETFPAFCLSLVNNTEFWITRSNLISVKAKFIVNDAKFGCLESGPGSTYACIGPGRGRALHIALVLREVSQAWNVSLRSKPVCTYACIGAPRRGT